MSDNRSVSSYEFLYQEQLECCRLSFFIYKERIPTRAIREDSFYLRFMTGIKEETNDDCCGGNKLGVTGVVAIN